LRRPAASQKQSSTGALYGSAACCFHSLRDGSLALKLSAASMTDDISKRLKSQRLKLRSDGDV